MSRLKGFQLINEHQKKMERQLAMAIYEKESMTEAYDNVRSDLDHAKREIKEANQMMDFLKSEIARLEDLLGLNDGPGESKAIEDEVPF